jgi:diguanylate cyclase (GGDEF)-like protein
MSDRGKTPMPNPLIPIWRSISGPLYLAIGMLFVGVVATNIQTIIYADMVAANAATLAVESIAGVRAADAFDEILDRHRRALTASVTLPDPAPVADSEAQLSAIEREFAASQALTGAEGAPSAELTAKLRADVVDLRALARAALDAVATARTEQDIAETTDAYAARNNKAEDDVTAWKTQMREGTEAELAAVRAGAERIRTVSVGITVAFCLVGLIAVLIARGVLTRLHRLTASMLALAGGDLAANVPFRGAADEFGRLADALEVFRGSARQVVASEANMSAAIENMIESIAMFSPDQRVVLHNRKFADLVGLPPADCMGLSSREILDSLVRFRNWPVDKVRDLNERLMAIRDRTGSQAFDVSMPDGTCHALMAAILPNRNFLLCVEDITERRASAARIFHLAHHDSLTDLPNRALFHERLGAAVDDAVAEHGLGVTLLLCDLDRFKNVNDTYGHPAGDALLREVARRISDTMRKTDILARLGGDEFAIIHLSGGEPQGAHALADRIVAALRQPFEINGNKVGIGVSVGIAQAPVDARDPVELMKQADLALYVAKRGGRNMYAVYDASMAEGLEERRNLEIEIRKALDAQGFSVHYQPQVDLHTRHIIGFEALARWNHPQRGNIPPAVFIPIAEESSLILELGEWVLRRACADAASWGGDTFIAVNVSSQQFRNEDFIAIVRAALRDSGLPPQRLELEVTETAMLNDGEKMLAVLRTLHTMGIRLAMDDFGTGYSALNYLQKFPFDKIKIDQSFVRELGDKAESDAIVRAVAALGANLGITTVVEGIETEAQAQMVLDTACGEAQGFLFGHPVPVADVRTLLAAQEHLVLI